MSMSDLSTNIRERYEPNVFNSVRKLLKFRSVVFDVGAYDGITSDILATIVGPENVVIVEPGEMNWATIRAYWNAHGHPAPRATYAGFLADSDRPGLNPRDVIHIRKFPIEADQSCIAQEEEGLNFRLLSDRTRYPEVMARPWLKLDTLASLVVRRPVTEFLSNELNGIVLDVEGAELLVLRGAEKTIVDARPFIWIEIHPKLMQDFFGMSAEDLHAFMKELGYRESLLGSKINEEHWLFAPEEKS